MTSPALPGLDLARFEAWALANDALELRGPLRAEVIAGGLSNLSYALGDGQSRWVLRRPPLGHVLSTAHDIGREVRVMRGLAGSDVPVPTVRIHHDDADGAAGLGAEFSVVDFVDGIVVRGEAQLVAQQPSTIDAIAPELARVLARLHDVDPASAGLASFGRPEGFLQRQVARWRRQLDASRTRALPRLDALAVAVASRIPATSTVGIVHGDYRLDNTMMRFDAGAPRITAVLDWEMSTLGDVLTDLGLLEVYWTIHELPEAIGSPLASAIDPDAGFSTFDALLREYASARDIDLPDELGWYTAFASFKLAAILEGIHTRYLMGKTVGEGFDRVGPLVPALAERGLGRLSAGG